MRLFLKSSPLGWSKWKSKHIFMVTKVKGITYMSFGTKHNWWHNCNWLMPHHQKWQIWPQPKYTWLDYSDAQVSLENDFSIVRYELQNPWDHKCYIWHVRRRNHTKKHINSKNMMHRTSVWNLTTRHETTREKRAQEDRCVEAKNSLSLHYSRVHQEWSVLHWVHELYGNVPI